MEEWVPAHHPARRLVTLLKRLDLSDLYAQYAAYGPPAYDPRDLLALLLYGYLHGIYSSRHLERATYELLPCIYLIGGAHPDHSCLAEFRHLVLTRCGPLFTAVLHAARDDGHLPQGPVSGDGTKIHAQASKHAAVSYAHAGKTLEHLREQVSELQALALRHNPTALPPGMDLPAELQLRMDRIEKLEDARQVIEERADARYAQEVAAYEAKLAARAERTRVTGKKPSGKPPAPPVPGPRPTDQYNFTDPQSRIMKNSTNTGVDQHYNAQLVVTQDTRLIVGCTVTDQPNDMQQAVPLLESIPAVCARPTAAAFDAGYRSEANMRALEARGITPYIATGKSQHGLNWRQWFAAHPDTPPPAEAGPLARMDYAVTTQEGDAIYRQRKSTVEPVIGIIKQVLGFRQFSVRGLELVRGEWSLVCLIYNIKRLLTLSAPPHVQQAVHQAKLAMGEHCATASTAIYQCWQAGCRQLKHLLIGSSTRLSTQARIGVLERSCWPWPTGC